MLMFFGGIGDMNQRLYSFSISPDCIMPMTTRSTSALNAGSSLRNISDWFSVRRLSPEHVPRGTPRYGLEDGKKKSGRREAGQRDCGTRAARDTVSIEDARRLAIS